MEKKSKVERKSYIQGKEKKEILLQNMFYEYACLDTN